MYISKQDFLKYYPTPISIYNKGKMVKNINDKYGIKNAAPPLSKSKKGNLHIQPKPIYAPNTIKK